MRIRLWHSAILLLLLIGTSAAADLYQVEMLVFKRWDDPGGERFNALADLGSRAEAVGDVASRAAGAGGRRLNSAASKLSGKGHKILFHEAWRQSAGGRKSSKWYAVSGTGLQGVVRLTRGRYLHIDTDLTVGGIRIRDHRRMRSRELHYIDHPRVGILVRVDVFASAKATHEVPTSSNHLISNNFSG